MVVSGVAIEACLMVEVRLDGRLTSVLAAL